MKQIRVLLAGLFLALLVTQPILAQTDDITYTVQMGDTLSQVALKYNLGIIELAAYNNIANPNLIIAGQKLRIPSRAMGDSPAPADQVYTVQPGDTLFEIARQFGVRSVRIAEANGLANIDLIEVGQTLLIPATATSVKNPVLLPSPFQAISFSEERIAQGRTLIISATLTTSATLTAEFEDRPVFLTGDGVYYWGIVGIHALTEPGIYSVGFRATLPDGAQSAVAHNVVVAAGSYNTETINVAPDREGLLDPAVVSAEAEKMRFIWNQVSPNPLWNGSFGYPVVDARVTSDFGTRRSYGGGPVNGYHAGTDFGGNGEPIYAPAAGLVVLAEPLNVRGNAVLIDHGLGLFSGYWHQSQTVVKVGDVVAQGDIIGYIGNTGLVTGPHLHWEMRLGGIAVDPLQWVQERIPF